MVSDTFKVSDTRSVQLTVVGSINLDLVARVPALPRAGETLAATEFARIPEARVIALLPPLVFCR